MSDAPPPPPTARPAGKLRLLKVLVQPVLVLDDGETLREVACPIQPVAAGEWPTWAPTAFDDDALELLRDLVVPIPATTEPT